MTAEVKSEGEFSGFKTEFPQLFFELDGVLKTATSNHWFNYKKSKKQGYCFVVDVIIPQCELCETEKSELRICHKSGKVTTKCCTKVLGWFSKTAVSQWKQPVKNLPGNRKRVKVNPLVLNHSRCSVAV